MTSRDLPKAIRKGPTCRPSASFLLPAHQAPPLCLRAPWTPPALALAHGGGPSVPIFPPLPSCYWATAGRGAY